MSQNISTLWIELFDEIVHTKYQNEGFLLKGTTRTKTGIVGDVVHFPVYGGAVASPRSYRSDIVPISPTTESVSCIMQDWIAGDYTDVFEQQKVNFDEVSEVAKIETMAIGRQNDQMIIDAGINSGTTNTIADGGDNMTFEKVLQVSEYLDDIGVPQEDRYMLLSASAQKSLLQSDRITNQFYVSNMLLQSGSMHRKNLLGFTFIVIPTFTYQGQTFGLPKTGNIRTCLAFHKQAIGYAEGIAPRTEINYIPQKTSWLSAVLLSANAVAIDPTGIVTIDCDESA